MQQQRSQAIPPNSAKTSYAAVKDSAENQPPTTQNHPEVPIDTNKYEDWERSKIVLRLKFKSWGMRMNTSIRNSCPNFDLLRRTSTTPIMQSDHQHEQENTTAHRNGNTNCCKYLRWGKKQISLFFPVDDTGSKCNFSLGKMVYFL